MILNTRLPDAQFPLSLAGLSLAMPTLTWLRSGGLGPSKLFRVDLGTVILSLITALMAGGPLARAQNPSAGPPPTESSTPSAPAKPDWVGQSDQELQAYGAIRVEASGKTLIEAQANLQQEISLAVYKQLELQADRARLPADLAAQLRPEDLESSALLVDRVVEAIPSGDESSPMDAHYQAWARLRFSPMFPAAVHRQVQRLIQHQRVKQVTWVGAAGLLAVVLSFGYLQVLGRLPASWSGGGLTLLGLAWTAAVASVVVGLFRSS